MNRTGQKHQGRRISHRRGRPPLQALSEAAGIAAGRGEGIVVPGGRSDAFDIIICEKFRTVFVRVRRTDLHFLHAPEVLLKYRYDIARVHRLPLTQVTAREFWLRLKNGTWQFYLITDNGIFEIREDGTYWPQATLPVTVPDKAAENSSTVDEE
jgi:hypothetical protein